MAEASCNTEVYSWLKSLSPGLKLERLSPQFESRGFRSRRSLAYVKSDDLDSFFPSPDKLLLAERRILEAELNNMKTETYCQPRDLEPKRLNMTQSFIEQSLDEFPQQQSQVTIASGSVVATATDQSFQSPVATAMAQSYQSPLDRRGTELSENLKLLGVQVESARSHLQGKQKALEGLPSAYGRRGKACAVCHKSGHNRVKCKDSPCRNVNLCQLKDKHPELQTDIRALQRDLKVLEQKYGKAKSDNDVFTASRVRAKSSFFAIMRPRLRKQNPAKYLDRSALDRDLMVLQRALMNKVPIDEAHDWRLPNIMEEYKRRL